MKQDKVINIILAAVNIILMALCAALYLKSDRMEPVFAVQPTEIMYTPGMEEPVLYEGLRAYDDRDGDMTDRIVIEKVVENREEATAVIYYAVSDGAGNTAKFSKLFPAKYPDEAAEKTGR